MYITLGQLADVHKYFAGVSKDDCEIIAEAGNDQKTYFNGTFLVKIKRKGVYRFENSVMVKQVN
jgi:hypothetical protein